MWSKLIRPSDADEFASLITSGSNSDVSSSIETLSEKSFDPRSQYSGVIKAVRAAVAASDSKVNESDVEVKIYRVEVGHSRVEYWVIVLDGAEEKIVGLRAKAIES
jgi:Sec7-like guanine-nucleotide exchange factor